MGFTIRLGGWRPVQLEEGQGVLWSDGGRECAPVDYRFEVWHQMVAGFPGPFRSDGRISVVGESSARALGELELELEDGRRLALSLGSEGTFVAHGRPDD